MRKTGIAILATLTGIFAAGEREAKACGGCFVQTESTIVNDHRMVFALSKVETILWDQIRYGGAPDEFGWVLPVRAGTEIDISRDEWIAALDASTQPQVQSPPPASSSSGSGCMSMTTDSLSGASAGPSVQVVSEKVIGPYESVILRSSDPQALRAWLRDKGYTLPQAIEPVIDAYTAEKFDFAALRLRPGEGVRSMKPVRIVTKGADATLPLRMVAAGVGANVGLTLYVISEGRYRPQNFPEVQIDDGALSWDFNTSRSNYQELALAAMAQNDGRSWLVEYAEKPNLQYRPFTTPRNQNGNGSGPSFGFAGTPGLAQAYYSECEGLFLDAGVDSGSEDAGADDGGDASIDPFPTQEPRPVALCDAFDDLRVATRNLATNDVWVTRLRANLPAKALAEDLRLEASPKQTPVSNIHFAKDPDAEEDDGCSVTTLKRRPVSAGFALLGAAFVVARALRRRKRISR